MVGKTLHQYRLVERLAAGGMGTVYRAFDENLERDVAVKVLDAEVDDPEKRFRAEAVAIARLNHPGIASVYELFCHDGRWVMAMELVKGETLDQMVERAGALSPRHAAELCMEALAALEHSHQGGVVHRDLKPANLMVSERGPLKVMDFGIARVAGTEHLTNDGVSLGTPAYMAPEQVMGHAVDGRTDLYAMGVVFYRLVTGVLPFTATTPFDMAQAQVKERPVPVETIRPDLPPWVSRLVTRALAKAPEERFQTASEFRRALAEAVAQPRAEESPVLRTMPLPVPPAASRQAPMEAARSRIAAGLAIAVVAPLAAVVMFGMALQAQPIPDVARPSPAVAAVIPEPPPLVIASKSAMPLPKPAMVKTLESKSAVLPSPVTDAPAHFSNVKLLVVDGHRATERDVLLTLTTAHIAMLPANGGDAIVTLPTRAIAKATLVRAEMPVWDPSLAAPAEKIDMPGLFSHTRYWLTLQTSSNYAILRLDGDTWQKLIEPLEQRIGTKIER